MITNNTESILNSIELKKIYAESFTNLQKELLSYIKLIHESTNDNKEIVFLIMNMLLNITGFGLGYLSYFFSVENEDSFDHFVESFKHFLGKATTDAIKNIEENISNIKKQQ